jgi:GTPase SAR1 family protein
MELLLYMILPRIVVFKYEILYTKSIKDYWIEEAKNNNKNNASIFIIGNKLDEAQNKREVEAHNVELLLENNPVDKHFEVSAKSG